MPPNTAAQVYPLDKSSGLRNLREGQITRPHSRTTAQARGDRLAPCVDGLRWPAI